MALRIAAACGISGVGLAVAAFWGPAAEPTEFNRDIRPILSKCMTCHGPSAGEGQAGLRLDAFATATAKLKNGHFAIVPGKPEESEVIRRVFATDPNDIMPPPESHKTLSSEEKNLLRQWIAEGAVYKEHWAFIKPVRPAEPKVRDTKWPRNPIDRFILARIEKAGLSPQREADKTTLIRRVTLDITGLPPTPKEVSDFLANDSPNAYEKLVDRLLASPRYGERMAMDWMDYARYADSNGYQADYERYQWRWRDWVIAAFNKNMPYDQFTIEQIAGDLLPNATEDQRLATAFNRNHRINTEGGVIAEEWRVENVIDRVDTTSTVWMGLTAGCARCHDHKYDPISQKDFYRLFAYFNNVPESGTGEERPVNHPPLMKSPTPAQEKQFANLTEKKANLESRVNAVVARNLDKSLAAQVAEKQIPTAGLEARFALSATPSTIVGSFPVPKANGKVETDIGRSTGAVVTKDDAWLDLGNVGDVESTDSFSYGAWINPVDGNGAAIARMESGNDYRGWDLFFDAGRPMAHIVSKWPSDAVKVTSKKAIPLGKWSHVFVTYDGKHSSKGFQIYVDGKPMEQDVEADTLKSTVHTDVPLTIGRRTSSNFFKGKIDDFVFYRRALSPAEVADLANVDPAHRLLSIEPAKRTKEQKTEIARYWLLGNDRNFKKLSDELRETADAYNKLDSEVTTVMVMDELPKARDCYVLIRGQYDKRGDPVTAGLPAFLPSIPKGVPNNRLGLAKWLVSSDNPLTARVTANRFWERFFGAGLVSTSEDFGTRAEYPSHPELLDWMATELLRLRWNLKAFIKELVTSATYRQSSDFTEARMQRDPQNRLLSNGPRFRLTAEAIRDQALFVSGQLVEKLGGPSVRPFQPDGIWDETNVYGNLRNYMADKGEGRHRRSLYTIWKRTAAPPDMTLFDAPERETCRVRRARTNTPLQALTLLNDQAYVEAARALAERILFEGGNRMQLRVEYAFRLVLSRLPSPREQLILSEGITKRIAQFRSDPKSADDLLKQSGEMETKLNKAELAAYLIAANTLLNLDEAITRE